MTIEQVLRRGPASSRDIQQATGKSQAWVAQQLRNMRDHVVILRDGRRVRYVMTRNAFGANDHLLLFVIDAFGSNIVAADIRPLAGGGFYVEPRTGMSSLLLGISKTGFFEDLPYFLMDLQPKGFIGKQIAAALARLDEEFPADPRRWQAHHIGKYLITNGEDLPGNLLLGHSASRLRHPPIARNISEYPELAAKAISGQLPGSSAGGEQPKFTCYSQARSAHVIVKFSSANDDLASRRWRDILLSEHHAAEALLAAGYLAAETCLIEEEEQLFLESKRFDRVGEFGRLSMISLETIDAEFAGLGGDWPGVVAHLASAGLVSDQHLYDTRVLWAFGRFINNTDMHLGNLSFSINGETFHLLPAYDMCSMGFAPQSGLIRPYQFTPPVLGSLTENILTEIQSIARDFWQRLGADSRISPELNTFLHKGNPADRYGLADSNLQTSLFS